MSADGMPKVRRMRGNNFEVVTENEAVIPHSAARVEITHGLVNSKQEQNKLKKNRSDYELQGFLNHGKCLFRFTEQNDAIRRGLRLIEALQSEIISVWSEPKAEPKPHSIVLENKGGTWTPAVAAPTQAARERQSSHVS